jgi:hypothetical protein
MIKIGCSKVPDTRNSQAHPYLLLKVVARSLVEALARHGLPKLAKLRPKALLGATFFAEQSSPQCSRRGSLISSLTTLAIIESGHVAWS